MLTCRELIDFLMAYLDGELPLAQRTRVRAHLALCRECRSYVRSYQAAVKLGKQSLKPSDEPAPGDVPEDLVKTILSLRPH